MRIKVLHIHLKKISHMTYVFFLLIVLFTSCENDDLDIEIPYVNRVVLAYMGGDNNLSSETYQKIEALCSGWEAPADGRLLIYSDPADDAPRLIEIVRENGKDIQKTIRIYSEENSADEEVLSRIIRETRTLYPSPSYGLILFSHASGWLPEGALAKPKSVLTDNGSEMELTNLRNAIPDNAFDFIIFEACFMSGIEVAYELKDKTDYILSSAAEILSPGFTPLYPSVINKLYQDNYGLTGFAEAVFNYFDQKQGFQRSATFSIIKTAELDRLAAFVKENCDFTKDVTIDDIQHFDRYSYRLFFDFEDYHSRLLETEDQQEELTDLINNCVIWKAATPDFMWMYNNGFEIKKHSGLTTYIKQDRFPVLNDEYQKLAWSEATGR